MYRDSYARPEQPSIVAVATIAATLLHHYGMNSHDAVTKSYELLEIAAAGQNREMSLPEAYKQGIEEHREMMQQISQLEQASDTSLPSGSSMVLMGDFLMEAEAMVS